MIATTPETQKLLAEATDWRMLGLLLNCPRPGWLEELDALAASSDGPIAHHLLAGSELWRRWTVRHRAKRSMTQ